MADLRFLGLPLTDDLALAAAQGRKTVSRRPLGLHRGRPLEWRELRRSALSKSSYDDGHGYDVFPRIAGSGTPVVGGIVWIRECFQVWERADPDSGDADLIVGKLPAARIGVPTYRADGKCDGPWRSSLTMPFWAARTFGRITCVTIERVGDITEEDAVREGFKMGPVPGCGVNGWWCHGTCARHGSCRYLSPARAAFLATYGGIYAHRGQPDSLCVRVEWEPMKPADVAELVRAQGVSDA